MTPENVISAILEGWPDAAANSQFWRVQYLKQLDVHRGPDLKVGWQRVLENNPKGFPPKPDIIAAMCRRLKREGQPVRRTTFEPSRQHYPLSDKELNALNRQVDAANRRIKDNGEDIFQRALLRVAETTYARHQQAVDAQ